MVRRRSGVRFSKGAQGQEADSNASKLTGSHSGSQVVGGTGQLDTGQPAGSPANPLADRAQLNQYLPCAVIRCMGHWVRAFGQLVGAGAARPEAQLRMPGAGRVWHSRAVIPDVPRREAAAGADRRAILTEARARRERALAYRATVAAVYAKAEPGVVAPPTR